MTGKEMAQIRQIAEIAKANTVTPSDGYAHIITTYSHRHTPVMFPLTSTDIHLRISLSLTTG